MDIIFKISEKITKETAFPLRTHFQSVFLIAKLHCVQQTKVVTVDFYILFRHYLQYVQRNFQDYFWINVPGFWNLATILYVIAQNL